MYKFATNPTSPCPIRRVALSKITTVAVIMVKSSIVCRVALDRACDSCWLIRCGPSASVVCALRRRSCLVVGCVGSMVGVPTRDRPSGTARAVSNMGCGWRIGTGDSGTSVTVVVSSFSSQHGDAAAVFDADSAADVQDIVDSWSGSESLGGIIRASDGQHISLPIVVLSSGPFLFFQWMTDAETADLGFVASYYISAPPSAIFLSGHEILASLGQQQQLVGTLSASSLYSLPNFVFTLLAASAGNFSIEGSQLYAQLPPDYDPESGPVLLVVRVRAADVHDSRLLLDADFNISVVRPPQQTSGAVASSGAAVSAGASSSSAAVASTSGAAAAVSTGAPDASSSGMMGSTAAAVSTGQSSSTAVGSTGVPAGSSGAAVVSTGASSSSAAVASTSGAAAAVSTGAPDASSSGMMGSTAAAVSTGQSSSTAVGSTGVPAGSSGAAVVSTGASSSSAAVASTSGAAAAVSTGAPDASSSGMMGSTAAAVSTGQSSSTAVGSTGEFAVMRSFVRHRAFVACPVFLLFVCLFFFCFVLCFFVCCESGQRRRRRGRNGRIRTHNNSCL
eukprot:TRINITY_DN5334_c0_g2_i1.p1 TRINITY_DN5334_c0_g2~~TRINITY_DN5334_c0_g2_i1.p1  ORF type:complete len:562 (-),score=146.31 TRINITY_DN5334_c0_g2_i1:36-1721(-)